MLLNTDLIKKSLERSWKSRSLKLIGLGLVLIFLTGIFSGLLFSGTAAADSGGMNIPLYEEMADHRLIEQRDQYLESRGWELGSSSSNPNNAYIGWGASEIKSNTGDKRFGQSRIMAFEDALMEARGEFVLSRESQIVTETVSEFLLDELPEPEQPTENWDEYIRDRASVALEKAMDLGEAQLNQLLERFDIDPDEYHSAERVEREQIFHDAIYSRTRTEALESVPGLIIEHTFEDNNRVGVLVKFSQETEEIARQIAQDDALSLSPSYQPRISLSDFNELDPEDLMLYHGVRIMENDEGENVFISFGQWSPAITETTSETLADARLESARQQARSRAEAALTNFVDSMVEVTNISEIMEEEEIFQQTTEGRVEETEAHDLGEFSESIVQQYGRVALEGITTVDTWGTNHPQTGHIVVGHILKWSPETRDAARGDISLEEEVEDEEEDEGEEEEEDEGEILEPPL